MDIVLFNFEVKLVIEILTYVLLEVAASSSLIILC